MIRGILLYDDEQGRFVVQPLLNDVIDENTSVIDLHCGNCLTIHVKQDDWIETRIENDTNDDLYGWYFVGVGRAVKLIGHHVEL